MRRMTETKLQSMLFQAIGKASLGLHTDATRSVVRQIVAEVSRRCELQEFADYCNRRITNRTVEICRQAFEIVGCEWGWKEMKDYKGSL